MAITGAKTNLFEDLLLNHFFRGGAAPTTGLYIGLITGNPTFDDDNALTLVDHEVAPLIGYTRQLLNQTNMGASSDGIMSSAGTEINFGTSVGSDWGTVTGFTISTASGDAAGDTYYYGIFDTEKSVQVGDSVRITAGNLSIEER